MSANTLGRVGAATLGPSICPRRSRKPAGSGCSRGRLEAPHLPGRHRRGHRSTERTDRAAGHLLASVRHLGLQARDAVMQAARFAPGDAGASEALHALADDLSAFAEREAIGGARLLDPTMEVARPAARLGRLAVRSWPPAALARALTENTLPASQERLAALGPNAARIWVINGEGQPENRGAPPPWWTSPA